MFASIQSIDRKEYMPKRPSGETYHLLELTYLGIGRFGGYDMLIKPTAFLYENGQNIYSISLFGIQNKGKVSATEQKTSYVQELEQIVKLHKEGAIDDAEFEAAKKKLLGL
jgi:hypothetical protein